ncbi:MAG: NAD(P)/FAD-dependent oxidoreductase [Cellulomonas sp.]|nr:NAD(P)/FAD-dependent oxidoreductase [Cellulomonas sp.]
MRDIRDLTVVGAGPSGLFATYYAGFRGLAVTLVDAQPEAGGQISALYPAKTIHDVAGFPSVTGTALVAGLLTQAREYAPRMFFDADVIDLVCDAHTGIFTVVLKEAPAITSRAVVIATGVGGIHPKRLPVGHEWWGRGVTYLVTDPGVHVEQDIVIIGGGDSALDWALQLRPIARSVTVVHRRRAFRAHAGSLARAAQAGVVLLTECEVQAVDGDHRVRRVSVRDAHGHELTLPADTVVGALGLLSAPTPFDAWGLQVEGRHVVVDAAMQTSVPGVFAVGDASTYGGKVALIATGFGEAATAVNNAAVHIDPHSALVPGHSTEEDTASSAPTEVPVGGRTS